MGWLLARELLGAGIDLALAPRLDLRTSDQRAHAERGFHRDPEVVGRLDIAFMRGMQRAGMAPVAKHFPGSGGIVGRGDPDPPRDPRDRVDVTYRDAIPFARLVHKGVPALQTAYVSYPAVEPAAVAYAGTWLQGVVRGELGFSGALLSHDVGAEGATDREPARCAAHALEAGCDMAVAADPPDAGVAAVEGTTVCDRPASQARLIRLHGRPTRAAGDRATPELWHRVRATVVGLAEGPLAGSHAPEGRA